MKKIISILLAMAMLTTAACSESNSSDQSDAAVTVTKQEMTLKFGFGERVGTYTGEVDDNGLPDGTGTFKSKNDKGVSWSYEGDWKSGHFEGHGVSTWNTGDKYSGEYKDDYANGYGEFSFSNGNKYIGYIRNDDADGQGELFYYDGNVQRHFLGEFKDYNNAVGYVRYTDGSTRNASILNGEIHFTEDSEPKIGMTTAEAYSSTWGAPKKTNKTTNTYGVTELWIYDRGTITFSDGVITSISEIS